MRVMTPWAVAFVVLLAGCGTNEGVQQASVESSQPTATSSAASTSESTSTVAVSSVTATSPQQTPDLAVFIAAVNEAMQGTSYEDAALRDPEVFIGVGQLFCELLDEGGSIDGVLGEYLVALADEGTGVVSDDDVVVAGVLMGASSEVLCPEHGTSF